MHLCSHTAWKRNTAVDEWPWQEQFSEWGKPGFRFNSTDQLLCTPSFPPEPDFSHLLSSNCRNYVYFSHFTYVTSLIFTITPYDVFSISLPDWDSILCHPGFPSSCAPVGALGWAMSDIFLRAQLTVFQLKASLGPTVKGLCRWN